MGLHLEVLMGVCINFLFPSLSRNYSLAILLHFLSENMLYIISRSLDILNIFSRFLVLNSMSLSLIHYLFPNFKVIPKVNCAMQRRLYDATYRALHIYELAHVL